jgi:SAM-dependent methyltransferase
MGSTVKTLVSLMSLTNSGALPPESEICDIGATQLFGDGVMEGTKSFLSFYSSRTAKATPPDKASEEKLQAIANNGFLGDLLLLAGFKYTALDIFHGTNTVLFDLNVHAPGPKLAGRFDLVMNFGTTEHVFNQYRAFQTIHDLTKVGGVIYHDLPMAGYLDHALFRYDPLFFRTVLPANGYELLEQKISMGADRDVSDDLRKMGYDRAKYVDVGIEVIVRRLDSGPFKIPMEASTALSIDPQFENVSGSDYVTIPHSTHVTYGTGMDVKSGGLAAISGHVLLKELLGRAKRRFGI